MAAMLRHLMILLALAAPAQAVDPSPDVTEPPPYAQFIVIPLRIHILTSTNLPDINCKLTDADIARITGKINTIWHNAGVHFGLESIVHEPAARQDEFKAHRPTGEPTPFELYRLLMPKPSREFAGLHVYYIHQFHVNGVFMGEDFAFVQETASLRKVDGGIDEPIPRVSAHELGHALSLPHRQDRTNLLASGTTGTLLNTQEVEKARQKALRIKGAMKVDDCQKAAEDATRKGDLESAKRLGGWLAEISGKKSEGAK